MWFKGPFSYLFGHNFGYGMMILLEMLLVISEAELGFFVCDHLFGRRREDVFACLLQCALIMGLFVIGSNYNGYYNQYLGIWLIVFAMMIGMVRLCYRVRLVQVVTVVFLLYGLLFSVDFVVFPVVGAAREAAVLGAGFENVPDRVTIFYLHLLFRSIEGIGIAWLVRKRAVMIEELQKNEKPLFITSCLCFAIMLVLHRFWNDELITNMYSWMRTIAVCGLAGIVPVYLAWRSFHVLREERRAGQQRQDAMQFAYQAMKDENLKSRKRLHDEKTHFRALTHLLSEGQTEAARNYLTQLTEEADRLERNVWTGDEILDMVLSWKVMEAREAQIEVSIDATVFLCTIPEKDLCSLVGNLMDNAIDASRKLESEKRHIQIKVKSQGKFMTLSIENALAEAPRIAGDRYLSAKRGYRAAGVGIQNVKEIVERYQGKLEISHSTEHFCAEVFLVMP